MGDEMVVSGAGGISGGGNGAEHGGHGVCLPVALECGESGWTGERTGDAFQLTNGTYDICGTLDDGALREMNIRRVDAAESPSP